MNDLLEVLRREAPRFAPELARLAYQRGLAVTARDGTTRPIPVTATPVVLASAELQHRAALTARLASATVRMARHALGLPEAERYFGALSPTERRIVERTWRQVARLAVTRVDYFVDRAPRALEVNATIPAMQGYSDIAAHTFLEVVGRHLGVPERALPALVAANGSNSLALYRALLLGYAAERGGRVPERIALLCRRHDAQITEQRHLAARFRDFGTEADVVHPDEVGGTDAFEANGKRYDLVYRHLFLRRLDETPAPWIEDFFSTVPGQKAVFLNPPASQVEMKAVFALLSEALHAPALAEAAGLLPEELAAVQESVPWTRPFRPGPAVGPDGERVDDLVARVAAEPARFVLKRSWDYGGKAVFLGRSVGTPAYEERVKEAYGEPLGWAALCARAAEDGRGGGLVVQEIVDTAPEPHLLCTDAGVRPLDLFVDFSCYASVGLGAQPAWGGVCRGSSSEIVNIVGGGGVLPLLTAEVAQKLLTAWRARGP